MPTNDEPAISEDIEYNIATTKPSTYDPNKDVTMLQAKIKALEEYVELLLNVIDEHENKDCCALHQTLVFIL
jgi:hypothetical protein